MRKDLLICLVLSLSLASFSPAMAQQRRSGARANTTPATRTTQADAAADSAAPAANAAPAAPEGGSQAAPQGGPQRGPQGGPGQGGPSGPGQGGPRMNGFAVMGLQMQAREAALEDGKVKISTFQEEYLKALKAADTNNDGKLSNEELEALQEQMRANVPNGGGPGGSGAGGQRPQRGGDNADGARRPSRGAGRNTGANATSANDTVVRGQAPEENVSQGQRGGRGQRGAQGGPNGQGEPQGGPGQGDPGGQGGFRMPEPTGLFKVVQDARDEESGEIDLAKFESGLKAALTEADKDNDGYLDQEEWNSFSGFGGMRGGQGGPGGMPGMNMDPNMQARMRAMVVTMFQRQVAEAARTEDGRLDIAKFREEYQKILKEADANKDGSLDADELQALQEKARESMGFGGPGGQGGPGFGGPGQGGPGGFGRGGGQPFAELRDDGNISLAKLGDSQLPDQLKEALTNADADGNGLLSEEELRSAFQNMRPQGGQGGPGGPGGFPGGGPGFGGQGGPQVGPQGGGRGNRGAYAPVSETLDSETIVRGQAPQDDGDGQGQGRRGGRGEGRGGQGGPQGGPNGQRGPGGQGGPGFGGPGGGFGRGGFGGGFGFGRMGESAVQSALTKSISEEKFVIATFDEELAKALANADNEDDGFLDIQEQTDAFGMPLTGQPGGGQGGPQGERPQGERGQGGRGPQGEGGQGGRGQGEQGNRGGRGDNQPNIDENVMRARMQPTPNGNYVGVAANDSFRFAKSRSGEGSGEKEAIENGYAIGRYEVRNREFKEFVDATKRTQLPKYWVDGTYPKGTKNCPVVGVTLQDAEDYCAWLASQNEGWTFRLPTEAEFENAAAGAKKQKYPYGTTSGVSYTKGALTTNVQYNATVLLDLAKDGAITLNGKSSKLADVATISAKGVITKGWRDKEDKSGFTYSEEFKNGVAAGSFLVPVYKYRENESPYGAIGMAGNAAEWTSTVVNDKNVVRGGSWYSSIDDCAATARGELKDPKAADPTIGFRVVAIREMPEGMPQGGPGFGGPGFGGPQGGPPQGGPQGAPQPAAEE